MSVMHSHPLRGEPAVRAGRLDDEEAAAFFADAVSRWGRPSVIGATQHSDVIELCRQIEGWPLAIELAARRTAVQSVPELLAALRSGSLAGVLDSHHDDTGGQVEPTIRGAVTESLACLRSEECCLAANLTGFLDWSTFTEIADGTPGPVALDTLEALVEHHVLDVDATQTDTLFRLRRPHRELLLELARDDRALEARVLAAAATRHTSLAAQSLTIVDRLIGWSSAEQEEARWYEVVRRRERDLRAAAWTLLDRRDTESIRAGARISLALSLYAAEIADLAADGGLLDRALAVVSQTDEPWIAVTLEAYRLRRRFEAVDPSTDTAQLAADLQSAVSAARGVGDHRVILECLAQSVGSARTIGHLDQARRHADEGVELAASVGMHHARASFELLAAMVAHMQGRFADSAERATRAYSLARRLDQGVLVAQASLVFHQLPPGTPNVPLHRPSVRDLAGMVEGLPARRVTLGLTDGVAAECLVSGDLATAARAAATGIRKAAAIGLPAGVATGVMIVALLAAASGQTSQAARLHGAVADHLKVVRHSLSPGHRATYEAAIGTVRSSLGEEAFSRECGQGASWTWARTVEAALETAQAVAGPPDQSAAEDALAHRIGEQTHPALTARQLEVLSLLAAGMSNKEISDLLCMAPKTTMHHTSNIYRRLGVHGRGQAAALARRLGIA